MTTPNIVILSDIYCAIFYLNRQFRQHRGHRPPRREGDEEHDGHPARARVSRGRPLQREQPSQERPRGPQSTSPSASSSTSSQVTCYRGKLLNTHWSHKGWSAPASETQFIWWSMTHGGDGDIN